MEPETEHSGLSRGERLKERLGTMRAELFGSDGAQGKKATRPSALSPLRPFVAVRTLRTIVVLLAILFVGIFLAIFHDYLNTIRQIEQLPGVINLGRTPANATVFFGPSPRCGEIDCYLLPDLKTEGGLKIQLPSTPIAELPGFKEALASRQMFYRIPIEIPPALIESGEVLAFSPGWVNHERFEIFVNGRLIYEGQGRNSKETLVVIPIPKSFYPQSKILVAFKATVGPKDSGINHRGGMFFGPKAHIGLINTAHDRVTVTYFMLNLFSKGSVFVVFALIFLYTRATPGFFYFLIYAAAVTAENLIVNPEMPVPRSIQIPLYFQVKTLATYALFLYFAHHYRVVKSRRVRVAIGLTGHLSMLGLTVLFAVDKTFINLGEVLGVSNFLLALVLFWAVVLGVLYVVFLREKGVDKNLLRTNIFLCVAVSLYLALIFVESFFSKYTGMDRRYIFDLFFFFYFALANARSTGLNEGRIVTLEAHYEEKKRMEQELKEAALISQLLLPTEPPSWKFCDLVVFHKPTSESSGDWHAFESSPDGRLYHAILCDITGHGVQAAIVVATCKTVLSQVVESQSDLLNREDFLQLFGQRLGETLYRHGKGQHTATYLGMTFVPEENRLIYVLGGHPCPYMIVHEKGDESGPKAPTVKALLARSSPLGFTEKLNLALKKAEIPPAAEILIFTDGIPLATNLKPLKRFLAEAHTSPFSSRPAELYRYVWQEHESKTGSGPDDDVSIIWVRMARERPSS